MRWRLAFTPIYALLSERGGNSITICPFADDRAWHGRGLQPLAELEVTNDLQDAQASMTMDNSSSSQTSQRQTLDTRVLLSVSVVEDAFHDVSNWVSWLTTETPRDVTKVDVQVHSVFKSCSTLVVVSVPTYAWDRLPERPAYRFIGFIRSGDDFQAAKATKASTTELVSTNGKLMVSQPPSFQPHKRQRTDTVAQPSQPMSRRSSWLSDSWTSPEHLRATPNQPKAPEINWFPEVNWSPEVSWSPENDELLLRVHQRGLSWQSIASHYFPPFPPKACRERYEKLMDKGDSAGYWDGVRTYALYGLYRDCRQRMWKILADEVGAKWQDVELKVYYPTYLFALISSV